MAGRERHDRPPHLLATKLYIPPPRAGLISRMRLLERLQAGLRSKLTIISAPAGFGKTTLLGAWLAQTPAPAAWLALDAGDNSRRVSSKSCA